MRFIYIESATKANAVEMACEQSKMHQSDHMLAIDEDEIDFLELTPIE